MSFQIVLHFYFIMVRFHVFNKSNISIFLRIVVIFCKFSLVTILIKKFPIDVFGEYSLLVTSISYALIIIGCDFHSFSTRFLISQDHKYWFSFLKDLLLFYLLSYLVFSLFFFQLFTFNILSPKFLIWFYVILLFEHLSQEIYRILILLGNTAHADFLVFLRNGVWVFPIIFYIYNVNVLEDQKIFIVLVGWCTGSILSFILGIKWILRSIPTNQPLLPINWNLLKEGLKKSLFFFIGTISFCGLTTIDKYLIKIFTNSSEVGMYSFFYMLTIVINTLVEAGIINQTLPNLIRIYHEGDTILFNSLYQKMKKKVFLSVFLFFSVSSISINFLIKFLNKSSFLEYLPLYYLLELTIAIQIIGLIPHYRLFIMKKDSTIVYSTFTSFIFFVILGYIMTPIYGIYGVVVSLLLAFTLLFFLKSFYLRKMSRK